MVRLADGDRSAFDPLFRTLRPLLEGLASRLLQEPDAAQEVAQEALVAIFRRSSEFDRKRDALSWAYGITAFQCKTWRKRRQRRKESPMGKWDLAEALLHKATPEDELILGESLAMAEKTLASLSPLDQEAIRAALGTGPRPAVAGATFRKRLERALRRLRSAGRIPYDAQ